MKKTLSTTIDEDIPELSKEQLGKGVRGKFYQKYLQDSNVVVLRPEVLKAFPTSEAVNNALSTFLAFMQEAKKLPHYPVESTQKPAL